jgi:hypothetical protein
MILLRVLARLAMLLGALAPVLPGQTQPTREYIRLGGRVIAIETFGSGQPVITAPSRIVIGPLETAAFAADTAVNWSTAPAGFGTITAQGVYTAPASVVESTVVTITATSTADPAKSSSVTLTVRPVLSASSKTFGSGGARIALR